MSSKPQTNKDMLVTLLENVLVLTKGLSSVEGQVREINHTIHNGMSKAIHDTADRVSSIEDEINDLKIGFEKIKSEGHSQSCPFLAERRQKKARFWSGLAKWKKAVIWAIGAGSALYAWAQFLTYVKWV